MENLTLFDITNGISWTEDSKIFFTSNNPDKAIIVEYLNDVSLNDIDIEVTKLEKFNSFTNIKEKENYIANSLYGFDEFEDGYFAKVAGFDDFSIMALFDINTDSTFLRHVYGKEKYIIDIQNLIALLKKIKAIKTAFELS